MDVLITIPGKAIPAALRTKPEKSVINNKKKGLSIANQPQVHSGPLFHRTLFAAQITNFGIKPFIPGGKFRVLGALLGNGLIQRPHLCKTAFPDPQANLQQENKDNHCGPEQLHADSVQ
jgi:hypothetical protein